MRPSTTSVEPQVSQFLHLDGLQVHTLGMSVSDSNFVTVKFYELSVT